MTTAEKGKYSFAEVAIEQRLMTPQGLARCRQIQEESLSRGEKPGRIEDIAVKLGLLSEKEVHAVQKAIERFRKDHRQRESLQITGYRILTLIGEGGIGRVFKAEQVSMGRLVALKVLHKHWVEDDEFRKRFLLEARIVGKLSHNNLIQVIDVGKEKGWYYFSMEYVDGKSVEELIDENGHMDVKEAIDITIQTLRAIQYISRYNLVHRDIKPSNIMLTTGGIAKLGDFGFVKSRPELEKELGMEGMVLGTPDYISPEQAMGEETVDHRSDIYSLGASLYHMVTGNPPFEGSSSTVMEKHIKADVPSPKRSYVDVPDELCHIIEKMMAKRPEDRYEDFKDLFEDLELVKAGSSPATERIDAGKTTLFRAFRVGKDRLQEIKERNRDLEKRLRSLEQRLFLTLAALGVSILAALVFILLYAVKK
jgi:serine/threonine-protein kinase